MKKLVLTGLIAVTLLPTQAQLFSRESLGGAALGGLAGGIIGHNNGRRTAEGAAIGAGAGLLLGALVGHSRRDRYDYYYSDPAPSYYYRRPNYAVTGTVLGGIAGGVIGHHNGRRTAEGIAIGAGAGLVLGGLAEYDARRREVARAQYAQPVYVGTPATVLTTTPVVTQAAQEPVTVVNNTYNNYYGSSTPSPMAGANALFGR